MATSVAKTPMQTFILSFNPEDKRAAKFMETIKLMDFFKVEESPYDPEFVAKIQAIDAMDKREFKAVKSQDLWK